MAMVASSVKRGKLLSNGVAVVGIITASGSYSASGDTLDLSKIPGITNRKPDFVDIKGIAGYYYEYDAANGKVWDRQSAGSAAPMAEISATTYPAGVSGDTIRFLAIWLAVPQLP